MFRTLKTLAALTLALSVAAPAAAKPAAKKQAVESPYLFDLMKQPAYRKVWRTQIVPQVPKAATNNWIRNTAGPTSPVKSLTVGSKRYYGERMCQPHNCADNQIYFLISKQRAVVLHIEKDSVKETVVSTRYYGKPTEAEKAALQKLAADKEEK